MKPFLVERDTDPAPRWAIEANVVRVANLMCDDEESEARKSGESHYTHAPVIGLSVTTAKFLGDDELIPSRNYYAVDRSEHLVAGVTGVPCPVGHVLGGEESEMWLSLNEGEPFYEAGGVPVYSSLTQEEHGFPDELRKQLAEKAIEVLGALARVVAEWHEPVELDGPKTIERVVELVGAEVEPSA